MLAKNPAFTRIAIVAIALGIGANSVISSAVDAVLLRPLPFKNPEQLVMIWENATHLGFPKDTSVARQLPRLAEISHLVHRHGRDGGAQFQSDRRG